MRSSLFFLAGTVLFAAPSAIAQNRSFSYDESDQVAYAVPFDSYHNLIELSFANVEAVKSGLVRLQVLSSPNWIEVSSEGHHDVQLADNPVGRITFDVPAGAPVGESGVITIKISGDNGLTWYKEIEVKVEPPQSFELRSSYPNPFNPSATIPFVVPESAQVRVVAYDILGRLVATIVDDQFEPGLHSARFDGSALASGTYLVRATMESETSDRVASSVQMLTLLK